MKKKWIEKMQPPRLTAEMKKDLFVIVARAPLPELLTLDVISTVTKKTEVRICVTTKEYANYYVYDGSWDEKNLDGIMTPMVLGGQLGSYELYGKRNIRKILGKEYSTIADISRFEGKLSYERRQRREQSAMRRCTSRNGLLPEIKGELKDWLLRRVSVSHCMYYKRRGRYVQMACSACNKSGERIIEPMEYSEYTLLTDKPEHGMFTDCPWCGRRVRWTAAGRALTPIGYKDNGYIVDRADETVVVRYFEVTKEIAGTEYGAEEQADCVEVARNWFLPGKLQRDYQKVNGFTGTIFWDYKNLAGMANIQQKTGKVRLAYSHVLYGTEFQYSELDKQIIQDDYTDATHYLERYRRYPVMEMMRKTGMRRLYNALVDSYGIVDWLNTAGKKPADMLKITGERFRDMREQDGSLGRLRIYQWEKRKKIRLPDEQVSRLEVWRVDTRSLERIMAHCTLAKALNYVEKAAGRGNIRETLGRFTDYLGLLELNERQFTEHELYPADLTAAHNREVTLRNLERSKQEVERLKRDNPNIRKDAPTYNRNYRYQSDQYVIRAPKDAGEIYMEGLLLNHCVGRMGYIEAMNRHETVILFLRKKKERNKPYYTVEVRDGKIAQAYGYGDGKPDREEVDAFLHAFYAAKLEKKEERKVG